MDTNGRRDRHVRSHYRSRYNAIGNNEKNRNKKNQKTELIRRTTRLHCESVQEQFGDLECIGAASEIVRTAIDEHLDSREIQPPYEAAVGGVYHPECT